MDKQLSVQNTFNFQTLLESLPRNMMIIDSFCKAHSLICTGKYDKVLCSISGGSDNDIVIDIISKLDVNHIVEYVYFDTGLEYKATKEHITYLEERYGINILDPNVLYHLLAKKSVSLF